ncbi:MAG: isochorismatase family protein [Betaproteobacteria bacterium]|jgi:nicotinamidase-related amidase|nr:MAG: isochorismatase family protein [Betaproteobacteria bacterium]
MMSVTSTDKGLLTPGNGVLIFIDHQPCLLASLALRERAAVLRNVLVLAKAATIFSVPAIITTIRAPGFGGNVVEQLAAALPDCAPVERTSLNAWDCQALVASVRASGRRNLILAALWSDVCLAMPALQALTDGYGVYAVENASAGTSPAAHAAAVRRIEQAGAVSLTALQLLLELQRDCAWTEHYDEVMAVVAQIGSGETPDRVAEQAAIGGLT